MLLLRSQHPREPDARDQRSLRSDLERLDAWLRQPPPQEKKRRTMPDVNTAYLSGVQLAHADLPFVTDLYRRVVASSGGGKTYVEQALLYLLAMTPDPELVPFFVELLDLAPPRDRGGAQRREMALAVLGLRVYRNDDPAALAALNAAMHHRKPEVRARAIYTLSCIYVGLDVYGFGELFGGQVDAGDEQAAEVAPDEGTPLRRVPPDDLVAQLQEVASNDPDFAPRFMARDFLSAVRRPVPLEHPKGVYVFRVLLRSAPGMSRTIALRSEQTLDDLHAAIQRAVAWDSDHLYSFYLTGDSQAERYTFSCPYEEDNPPWTNEAVIGALGMRPGHRFLYVFDYGDLHQFLIELVEIQPRARAGKYPRVIAREGKNPQQYPDLEDDEWWDDDELLEDEEEV